MAVIDVNGARVAFAATGEGEPVVLLHCTGGSGAQWQSLCAALQDRFRLIAPDLYGYGDTEPWPGRGPLTLADEAAIVAALIDRAGAPVHLVGHSYGGAVALRAALEQPERISSLTLIEPASFHLLADDDVVDGLLFDEIQRVAEAIWYATASGDHAGGLECFVDYWSGDGAWAGTCPEAQQALARCIGAIALNFWSATTDSADVDACMDLTMPTLILCGGRSRPRRGGSPSSWPGPFRPRAFGSSRTPVTCCHSPIATWSTPSSPNTWRTPRRCRKPRNR